MCQIDDDCPHNSGCCFNDYCSLMGESCDDPEGITLTTLHIILICAAILVGLIIIATIACWIRRVMKKSKSLKINISTYDKDINEALKEDDENNMSEKGSLIITSHPGSETDESVSHEDDEDLKVSLNEGWKRKYEKIVTINP
ncbi:unnamed protein product [Moneuplotes crassus]|uniref:Uncharacterized protein n=1 Tax=Euplotes crassus TaxID=5936 RepID=A0AAD1XZZ6_EUPCR|nr:unnamed protein product [Moneuplotes crassus]